MAAVSTAMLRPPGGGLDPPYFTQPMMNYSPNDDKSKKSWGQRLKLSQNGVQASAVPGGGYGTVSGPGGSSLSKSMKYAETWLYGSVRAQPGLYMQYAKPQSPLLISASPNPVHNYAVVVCSCPEYINGTKKGSTKKVSICKKCKGSRLPLGVPMNGTVRGQVLGGTVRGPHASRSSGGTLRAGTVKLTPTSKSRPTILSLTSQNPTSSDPYDLMRRTRLTTPIDANHVGSQFTASRSRAKSISPVRNRGRRRSPSAETQKGRSKSVSRSKDIWYEDIPNIDNDMNNRRSILECDVNPYDLMQKMKMDKLRSVRNDDEDDVFADFENDETFTLKKLQKNLRQSKNNSKHNGTYSKIQAIGGQRIRVFGQSSTPSTEDEFVYDDVQVNGQMNFSEEDELDKSRKIQFHETSQSFHNETEMSKNSGIKSDKNAMPSASAKTGSASPRRPPRRSKTETSEEESESDRKESGQKTVTKQSAVNNLSGAFVANRSPGADSAIKSILKKPRADRPVPAAEPPRPPSPDRRLSGSHFYLPTPPANKSPSTMRSAILQRKKVQFLVENEIVSSAEQDLVIDTSALKADVTDQRNDEVSIYVNNERKYSSPISDEGTGRVYKNGSHNLVNSTAATGVSLNQNTSINAVKETRFRSRQSEGGRTEKSVEKSVQKATGCDTLVKVLSPETDGGSSPLQDGENRDKEAKCDDNDNGKGVALRRSLSERLTLQGSPEPPSFLDTMALRPRPPRAHSRQAFISTQSLVEIINIDKPGRPRDRPPPPPTPPSDSDSSQSTNSSMIRIVCGETNESSTKKSSENISIKHSNSDCNLRSNKIENNGIVINRRHTSDGRVEQFSKLSIIDPQLPEPPPRVKPKEVKLGIPAKKEPNYVKTRFVRDKHILEEVSNMIAFDVDEKATVQISMESPSQKFPSSGIHKISIMQNDETEDESENIKETNRKTSIMINGDACYSTVNVNNDTPLYQSSVTINDVSSPTESNMGNTVTISVYTDSESSNSEISSRHSNQIYVNNDSSYKSSKKQNKEGNIYRVSNPTISSPSKTTVLLDYETINTDTFTESSDQKSTIDKSNEIEIELVENEMCNENESKNINTSNEANGKTSRGTRCHENTSDMNSTSEEISELLKDPVEAVKRNLVPHVCGKAIGDQTSLAELNDEINPIKSESEINNLSRISFVAKLLEDPMLGHLAEGLDNDLVAKLIENSLLRLKQSRENAETKENQDEEVMSRLIDASLHKLQEERLTNGKPSEKTEEIHKEEISIDDTKLDITDNQMNPKNDAPCSQPESAENNTSSPSYESMDYESGLMGGASSDVEPLSDCYNASASELSTEDDNCTRSKFYQMLVDATLSEIEISNTLDDDHHYESIRLNADPIYEEIGDMPPPLPLNPPPSSLTILDEDKKGMTRSIFEGASKYDILSYLVDAKERGIVPEDSYTFNFNSSNDIGVEEEGDIKETIDHQRQSSDLSSRVSNLSNGSDSSEDNSLIITNLGNEKSPACKKSSSEIERNDSGVGSETSKCSRSRWQGHNIPPSSILDNNTPIHLCEDCDGAVETQVTDSGVMYAPLVCRKCGKKRAERKEIITEIVETEEKYGRDLQIILEEFYQPMLVAGLLTQEQLSAIFLNVEELLENNQTLAERLRDALEIAVEQGDEDLLTVNIGKLVLESAPMLHAFSSYCVRQGAASMLLSSLEKEKELLRIFLKVSQMENTVLRRMNLNSFLMVPVQRVTKYPLLLSRLHKVTPPQLEGRDLLRQAQQKIEQHLSHMNSEAKDVTSLKLWRRISSGASGRRSSSEVDMINIKLRKMAVDVLEWNHDEARFAMEGKLLFTQPNDNNWRKGRTIKLTPINALLVTNGKPTAAYKPCEGRGPCFPHNTGVREASLLLVRDKGGRAALLREPLFLDRCVVAADSDWDDYFELQEIVSKDTFIFKAEDSTRTKQWCQQLQYHSQGMGAWRKRRNALANIMINGMMTRN